MPEETAQQFSQDLPKRWRALDSPATNTREVFLRLEIQSPDREVFNSKDTEPFDVR